MSGLTRCSARPIALWSHRGPRGRCHRAVSRTMFSPPQIKRAAIVNLVVHGVVGPMLVWFLAYHCSVVIHRLAFGGGHYPLQFRAFMSVYNFVRPCFTFIIPIALALLWLDARVFALLYRQHGRPVAFLWFCAIPLLSASFIAFSVWALKSAW